jgi:hypothetical protein
MSRRTSLFSALVVATLGVALASNAVFAKEKEEPGILKTFTIGGIDAPTRVLTLKDAAGNVEVIAAGPAVLKFGDFKVGDRVAVRYFEPMLLELRPAGQPKAAVAGQPASPLEVSGTVEVTGTDPKVPSLSIKTADGQALTFQVGDKKTIETLKAGDKADITFMRPVATKIEKK